MQQTIFWIALGFSLATIYASFFEWTLHRYFMHRPFGRFSYAFDRHTLIHHRIFKADPSYHLKREEDNGHHLLHHRYMHRNFNVVLPLADLCLGTLLLRSKIHFKQAEGPSVPNVQPRTHSRSPVPC